MRCPQILLGFVATVSAIDAYFHLGNNCDGPWVACTNLNPGVCCFVGSASNSVGYRGIPTNWVIGVNGFNGGGCGIAIKSAVARNTNFVCLGAGGGDYTGTRYEFTSRKRAEVGGGAPQKADQLGLEDGTTYNIVSLDNDALDSLV